MLDKNAYIFKTKDLESFKINLRKLICFKTNNGITLLEITVVLIIVGILATITLPSFQGFINSGRANDAQNNLLSIYVAQTNLRASGAASYCVDNPCAANNAGACTTTADLNACLGLSIVENNITYGCEDDLTGFMCTASITGGTFTMTLTNVAPRLTGSYNDANRNPRCTAGTCPN